MDNLISLTEHGALHGLDTGNLRRLATSGRLPAQKIGKQWVIDAEAAPTEDRRVKSEKYVRWLNPKETEESSSVSSFCVASTAV